MAGWKYYVYEIMRDERVVYVGKGCGKRAYASAKQRQGTVRFIAYFQHEEWALKFERSRIVERLSEGCRLLNVSNGNKPSFNRRTDTREMAREVLESLAWRIGSWIKAGRTAQLSKICGVPEPQLIEIYQAHG